MPVKSAQTGRRGPKGVDGGTEYVGDKDSSAELTQCTRQKTPAGEDENVARVSMVTCGSKCVTTVPSDRQK